MLRDVSVMALVLLLAWASGLVHAAEFRPLDGIPLGVSGDGNVVVGYTPGFPSEAVRWENGTRVGVGFLPGATSSWASAASADGSVIVGTSGDSAFRYEVTGGCDPAAPGNPCMVGLGFAEATAVSDDGRVIVGASPAVRWEAGNTVPLGAELLCDNPFPGGSRALGISGDGSTVVGVINCHDRYSEAFRWREREGCPIDGSEPNPCLEALGHMGSVGRDRFSEATDASRNGRFIVGGSESVPFLWARGSGMEGLGSSGGSATAVSGDGRVIVGGGFIWTKRDGLRPLIEVLAFDHGLDLRGWRILHTTGISDDGRVIVGFGTNPAGETQGWVADLRPGSPPFAKLEPGDILLAGSELSGSSGTANVLALDPRTGSTRVLLSRDQSEVLLYADAAVREDGELFVLAWVGPGEGLFRVDLATGAATEVGDVGPVDRWKLAIGPGGNVFVGRLDSVTAISIPDGQMRELARIIAPYWGAAVAPEPFGDLLVASEGGLLRIDPVTGTMTTEMRAVFRAAALAPNGELFAVSEGFLSSPEVVRVLGGATRHVADLPFGSYPDFVDLAFGPRGELIASIFTDAGTLVLEIDTASGETRTLALVAGQVLGIDVFRGSAPNQCVNEANDGHRRDKHGSDR